MSLVNTSVNANKKKSGELILPVFLTLISALPIMLYPYLPMTDLPQHFATLSILSNLDDPFLGFSQYYEYDFTKTLYILPYLVAWGLTKIMPVDLALKSVVFLSLIIYPLGLLPHLRSQGKPAFLALLAIPLVYNVATFWGLFNFNLAMGVSFFAFYLFSKDPRSLRDEIALAVLCLVLTTTHLYGTALIVGYAVLWGILLEGKNTIRRYVPLAPCFLGIILWAIMWKKGTNIGQVVWTPIVHKFLKFENAILGGYKDWSETWILCGFGLIITIFSLYGLWTRKKGIVSFAHANRVFLSYIILNFLAYLILPLHIPTATFIHPRHALLALCFLPLVLPVDLIRKLPIFSRALLMCLALTAIGNNWYHLHQFSNEAKAFDTVIDQIPMNPKVAQLSIEKNGKIMMTAPYLHFLTYIQGKKGGIVATGFAQYIWMAPIKIRDDVTIPRTAVGFEWWPELYDYDRFGYYYDYLLIRGYQPLIFAGMQLLPFECIYSDPPWRLYKSTKNP